MLRRLVGWGLALSVLSGCPGNLVDKDRFLVGRDGGGGAACDVENDIFKMQCATAGCHDAVTKTQFLDLESPGIKARIKSQMATCTSVVGQPLGTFMIAKVKPSPSCGGPMPLGGLELDAAEIRCIEDYIADGGLP